ncbi:hypothetical protein HYC85_028994 [Camellia sinensis]|uniref:Cytochrome P450 n=1 Tax=Camellia sinensis TaxID=4442 RepID=A0A7J7FWQ8_CAMSI|nr:hypothetical protein HYC85_028994 [Camellia sinensis]
MASSSDSMDNTLRARVQKIFGSLSSSSSLSPPWSLIDDEVEKREWKKKMNMIKWPRAERSTAAAGYVIPKGCFVVPFLSAVHLDENLYEGAITFNPWRWMDPLNQEKRNWRSSPFYAPFGGGGRFCLGAELARLQIALFLQLLRYYIQVDPTQGGSDVFLSFSSISEWLSNPNNQTG